jgi:hypothetical protein
MLLLRSPYRKDRYRSLPGNGGDGGWQMAGLDVSRWMFSREAGRSAGSSGPFRAGAFLISQLGSWGSSGALRADQRLSKIRIAKGRCRNLTARLLLAAVLTLLLTAESQTACLCRCVDGEMQPLCESSIDVPPVCPVTVCAIVPPSVRPIQPLGIPPLGTSQCSQRQVLNPITRQYEWRSVCN